MTPAFRSGFSSITQGASRTRWRVGHIPVAPSAVPMSLPGSPTPRELTSSEIEDIIERFVTAAAVCETAGFDGVQVHGAHGYLVTQFLSPLTNLRTDEWGGDPSTTDAVPPGDRPPHPRPGITWLRGERETQLGGLPTRRIQRGRITRAWSRPWPAKAST